MAKQMFVLPRLFSSVHCTAASALIFRQSSTVSALSSKRSSFQRQTKVQTGTERVRSVLISQSADIFTNLALEDWIYRNFNFSEQHVLLFWCNSPTVVIGRHQNPWLETNTEFLENQRIALARRNSGGGTVYHDVGNLNCTFFTTREKYKRLYNLEIICRALEKEWGVNVNISPREDIILNGEYKISGTAAKLGPSNAYHHCTVMVNVNSYNLHDALQKEENIMFSRATSSVQSPVKSLMEVEPTINVESLLSAVGREFLRTDAAGNDGGVSFMKKQRGFQLVNPTEEWFPGLDQLKKDFQSWQWIYGKTPKFAVTRSFPIPKHLINNGNKNTGNEELTIEIQVNYGCIEDVKLKLPEGFISGMSGDVQVVTHLKGKKFSREAVREFESSFVNAQPPNNNKKQFVGNCFKKLVHLV